MSALLRIDLIPTDLDDQIHRIHPAASAPRCLKERLVPPRTAPSGPTRPSRAARAAKERHGLTQAKPRRTKAGWNTNYQLQVKARQVLRLPLTPSPYPLAHLSPLLPLLLTPSFLRPSPYPYSLLLSDSKRVHVHPGVNTKRQRALAIIQSLWKLRSNFGTLLILGLDKWL